VRGVLFVKKVRGSDSSEYLVMVFWPEGGLSPCSWKQQVFFRTFLCRNMTAWCDEPDDHVNLMYFLIDCLYLCL